MRIQAVETLGTSAQVEVEGLDVGETAECLGISTSNVKVRLHRARSQLRTTIDRLLGMDVRLLHQGFGIIPCGHAPSKKMLIEACGAGGWCGRCDAGTRSRIAPCHRRHAGLPDPAFCGDCRKMKA